MKNADSTLFIALKLTAICFVSVLLLSIINLATAPQIKKNKEKAEKEAMNYLMPDADSFSSIKHFSSIDERLSKDFYYYEAYGNGGLIGYIVTSQNNGYGGKMKVMIAFDQNLKIVNAKLLDNSETPGLGKKAENDKYMNKFKNTNTDTVPLPLNKNMLSASDKDSVTGATITFNGIVGAIKKAADLLKNDL
jgi:electron transport complex protein RnfG